MARGEKRGPDDSESSTSKRRRAAPPPPADNARDAFLFREAWRVFRGAGWSTKRPPTRSLDTRYKCVPGGNSFGKECVDYVLGGAGVVAEYMKCGDRGCAGVGADVVLTLVAPALALLLTVVVAELEWFVPVLERLIMVASVIALLASELEWLVVVVVAVAVAAVPVLSLVAIPP
ncbi:hypothetical protein PF002_g27807 [Phytophthora fragariae]|uniref:Uncharacterized protein n=1 Tax=Phytophthora fragariae TaxID=53985 RepID=A0A6A3W761_9STRA|nr:hypothetical protein PF002_g27807 [Phytophthora fragariae]